MESKNMTKYRLSKTAVYPIPQSTTYAAAGLHSKSAVRKLYIAFQKNLG